MVRSRCSLDYEKNARFDRQKALEKIIIIYIFTISRVPIGFNFIEISQLQTFGTRVRVNSNSWRIINATQVFLVYYRREIVSIVFYEYREAARIARNGCAGQNLRTQDALFTPVSYSGAFETINKTYTISRHVFAGFGEQQQSFVLNDCVFFLLNSLLEFHV